jgi:N-acetylneuraminic acid mutarotase
MRTLAVLALAASVITAPVAAVQSGGARTLTIDDRVAAQRAIEQVYWNHRIWPQDNPGPKPPLSAVLPESALRARVEDGLRKSAALEMRWKRPLTTERLQAELDRMASSTRNGHVLRELFDALGGDPFLIAETLVREALVDRETRDLYTAETAPDGKAPSFGTWWMDHRASFPASVAPSDGPFTLPDAPETICTSDTWQSTAPDLPAPRMSPTAVWTGSEMIVWGGNAAAGTVTSTGGRYDPATNSWRSVDSDTPDPRSYHTAVWTGTEMIVWGGMGALNELLATGARYNPTSDSWTTTAVGPGVASAREGHTAVWSGTRMLIWGGGTPQGSRYDPASDTWSPMSTGASCPSARSGSSAIWTGTEMIVWGGGIEPTLSNLLHAYNDGGRYNPVTNVWTATSIGPDVPAARWEHTAVWTGTEMIVWGGALADTGSPSDFLKSGGRYNPSTDSWSATSVGAGVPVARATHDAVWTGTDMIVWGGYPGSAFPNTGGRYNPSIDSWTATSTGANTPAGRQRFPAVFTGTEMIVWGGWSGSVTLNSGGRYCAPATSYRDADGDGYGVPTDSITTTDGTIPPGYAPNAADCNDGEPAIHPGAVEVCNGIDDNCNGMIDEDALGEDYDSDGVRDVCDNCPLNPNPDQADIDGDGRGNPCDNCVFIKNADQSDVDLDGRGDVCDNCPTVSNPVQEDADFDAVGDACDNCPTVSNPSQSDLDHNGIGDACDLNDGLIWVFGTDDKSKVEWQQESGPSAFNVYFGDLGVLRATGVYTQIPGSNPSAARQCGIAGGVAADPDAPAVGSVKFSLVTGVTGGVEGNLGTDGSGAPRPNTNPCP